MNHQGTKGTKRALLGLWWAVMPDWAKHAFCTCPAFNRAIQECALQETTTSEMQWKLCEMLYKQRDQWRDTALKNEVVVTVKRTKEAK